MAEEAEGSAFQGPNTVLPVSPGMGKSEVKVDPQNFPLCGKHLVHAGHKILAHLFEAAC